MCPCSWGRRCDHALRAVGPTAGAWSRGLPRRGVDGGASGAPRAAVVTRRGRIASPVAFGSPSPSSPPVGAPPRRGATPVVTRARRAHCPRTGPSSCTRGTLACAMTCSTSPCQGGWAGHTSSELKGRAEESRFQKSTTTVRVSSSICETTSLRAPQLCHRPLILLFSACNGAGS